MAASFARVAPPAWWPRAWLLIARRERDVRDTLWLLLTLAWVLAPHVAELPVWCSAAVATMIVWRGWLTWRGHRLPHRLIPIALTCVAGIAVWLQYHTIFGKDAGVTFVVLLLGLKLLEMRAQRDIFVVIFLSLFVMLTSLFESQSIAMAGALVVGLWMLVTALVSVQFRQHEPRWRTKAVMAARLVAFALPLMAILFVLFPRIDGPLWGMPTDAYSAKTGLSDSLSMGSFGRLAQSRDMAFRARFAGARPLASEMYWRGPVLGVFDGLQWTVAPESARRGFRSTVTVDRASAVDYTVTLEPTNRPWLLALDVPGEAPTVASMRTRMRSDLQLVGEGLVRERVQYTARSYTRYRADVDETRVRLQRWLELPAGFDPRARAFAARLQDETTQGRAIEAGSPDEVRHSLALVDRLLTMIRTQGFVYTLDPPPLGRDSIDEFLFDSKRGFCEHYAAAFVFLMRALDVPARIVTGYQGGELNPVNGTIEVRERDAHAWAEVWIADRGWMRVDPTAAVAPDRIELGAVAALDETLGVGGLIGSGSWLSSLLQRSRFNWDAVANAWNEWILAYNADRQSGLFSGFGIERIDWQVLTIALIVGFGAVLSGIGLVVLVQRARVDPVAALYGRACDVLARAARREAQARGQSERPDAFVRRPSEGPRDYLARVRDVLPERLRAAADAAFASYERLRYGKPDDEVALRAEFARRVGALRA